MFDPAPTITRASSTFALTKRAESETLRRLRAARERISDKKRWCTGISDSKGRVCVIGAMALAAGFTQEVLYARTWNDAKPSSPTPYSNAVIPASLKRAAHTLNSLKGASASSPTLTDVWYVNDIFGHAAALQMLDRAIEIETQAAKD